jgi:tripartite-type tricarboxylate transporter receptor subunit TctC
MKVQRREFLSLMAAAATLPALPRTGMAQSYPTRPVTYVVSAPPGGPQDIFARLVAQRLSERFGQPFIVENRPGGGTNIATDMVVRAPADGHTLLSVAPAAAINASLYDDLKFNFLRDIAPVAGIFSGPFVVVVNASLPVKTVPELIEYAKVNLGKINFGSSGIGTVPHVIGELMKLRAGIDMTHVPYRGDAPALSDLLGNQIQLVFSTLPSSIDHVRAGNLRALAVTTGTRWEGLPDLPSLVEFIPGLEASLWLGLGAPKNTPAPLLGRINEEINALLSDASIKARFLDLGGRPLVGSPADFGRLIADETAKWGSVIKQSGVKPG